MTKYIDAEKLIKFKEALADIIVSSQGICTYQDCKDIAEKEALLLIATLQQEQPEVDLEREIIKYKVPFSDEREYLNEDTLDAIAKHFYELGLNARKEK